MERLNIFVIIGIVLLGIICIYSLTRQKEVMAKYTKQLPVNIYNVMIIVGAKKMSKDKVWEYAKFDWKKMLLVDGFLVLLCIFHIYREAFENGVVDAVTWIGATVFLILLCNVIALIIDNIRGVILKKNSDNIYIVPIYIHDALAENVIISYYNSTEKKIETKRIKFAREDIIGKRIYTCEVYNAIMKIKGGRMKYIGLDGEVGWNK